MWWRNVIELVHRKLRKKIFHWICKKQLKGSQSSQNYMSNCIYFQIKGLGKVGKIQYTAIHWLKFPNWPPKLSQLRQPRRLRLRKIKLLPPGLNPLLPPRKLLPVKSLLVRKLLLPPEVKQRPPSRRLFQTKIWQKCINQKLVQA